MNLNDKQKTEQELYKELIDELAKFIVKHKFARILFNLFEYYVNKECKRLGLNDNEFK